MQNVHTSSHVVVGGILGPTVLRFDNFAPYWDLDQSSLLMDWRYITDIVLIRKDSRFQRLDNYT